MQKLVIEFDETYDIPASLLWISGEMDDGATSGEFPTWYILPIEG